MSAIDDEPLTAADEVVSDMVDDRVDFGEEKRNEEEKKDVAVRTSDDPELGPHPVSPVARKLVDSRLFDMVSEETDQTPCETTSTAQAESGNGDDDEPDVPSGQLAIDPSGDRTPQSAKRFPDAEQMLTGRASPSEISCGATATSRRSSVSDSLMRTTAARENERTAWEVQLEEKKQAALPKHVKKQNPNYVPNDRLMRPTQSRLNERKDWEEHLKTREFEDDIWWEKRRPQHLISKTNENYNKSHHVASRLSEPTVAALQGKREKFPLKKEEPLRPVSPSRDGAGVAKIDASSPLLKGTCASLYQQVDKEGNLLYGPELVNNSPIVLQGQLTGPAVGSKLYKSTAAVENSKWVAPETDQQKKSPRKSTSSAASSPSARLLEFNAAMNAQRREKAVKLEVDKRESSWDSYHWREKIPKEIKPLSPNSATKRSSSGNSSNASASSAENVPRVYSAEEDSGADHVFTRLTNQLVLSDPGQPCVSAPVTPVKTIATEAAFEITVAQLDEMEQQSEQQECKEDAKSECKEVISSDAKGESRVSEAKAVGADVRCEDGKSADDEDEDEEEDALADDGDTTLASHSHGNSAKRNKKKNKRNKKA